MHNVVDNSPTTNTTSQVTIAPIEKYSNLQPKEIIRRKGCAKRLSPEQKMAVVAARQSGKTIRQISAEQQVSIPTVHTIINDKRFCIPSADEFKRLKRGITGMFYQRSAEALLSISQEKLDQSSALQLGTLAAIGVDKGRLMEGLSTENVSHRGIIESLEADRLRLSNQLSAVADEADVQPEQQVNEEKK